MRYFLKAYKKQHEPYLLSTSTVYRSCDTPELRAHVWRQVKLLAEELNSLVGQEVVVPSPVEHFSQ
eukprot:848918-Amphidinium_carterae.1